MICVVDIFDLYLSYFDLFDLYLDDIETYLMSRYVDGKRLIRV